MEYELNKEYPSIYGMIKKLSDAEGGIYDLIDSSFVRHTISGVKSFLFISNYDITKWRNLRKRARKLEFKIEKIGNKLYILKLERKDKKLFSHYITLKLDKNVYWLISIDKVSEDISPTLKVFLTSIDPYIYKINLNNNDFTNLINLLKERYEDVFISEIKGDNVNGLIHHKGQEANLSYKKRNDREGKLYEKAITMLKVECKDKHNRTVLDCTMGRDCYSTLHLGELKFFKEDLIENMVSIIIDKNEKFLVKERKYDKTNNIVFTSPFSFLYKKILNKESIEEIRKALHDPPFSSAILTSGNPFLSIDILDTRDMSSFEINIIGKLVSITPGSYSSPSAMSRISNVILTTLGEPEKIEM